MLRLSFPVYFQLSVFGPIGLFKCEKGSKDQESILSSTIPDPGYHMEKKQKHNKTSQTRDKMAALSKQVKPDIPFGLLENSTDF